MTISRRGFFGALAGGAAVVAGVPVAAKVAPIEYDTVMREIQMNHIALVDGAEGYNGLGYCCDTQSRLFKTILRYGDEEKVATDLQLRTGAGGPVMIGGSPMGGGSAEPAPKRERRKISKPVKGRLE